MSLRSTNLDLQLRAVVRLYFHATGHSPLTESAYDHHVDVLVQLLEAANDQKYTLTKEDQS